MARRGKKNKDKAEEKKAAPDAPMVHKDELLSFFKRVSVGGAIEEAVVIMEKDGLAICEAADLTNSLFVHVELSDEEFAKAFPGGEYAFGNVGLVLRYLESIPDGEEVGVVLSGNKVQFTGVNSKFQYLLAEDSGSIPTYVDNEEALNTLEATAEGKMSPGEKGCREAVGYVNMLGHNVVYIYVEKGSGEVSIKAGTSSSHGFKTVIGKCDNKDLHGTETPIYSKHLSAIISLLDFKGDIQFGFGSGESPLIIWEADNVWALSPVDVGAGEEG